MSDIFTMKNGLKQGDALQPLLFNFPSEYAIKRIEGNQDGLKLNGTHQPLVSVDVKIMCGSVHNTKKNTDVLVVASKETGLDVNAAQVIIVHSKG